MTENEVTYDVAGERLDRALQRLEASVRSLNGRMRAHARIEADTRTLLAERAKFASELDKVSATADEYGSTFARRCAAPATSSRCRRQLLSTYANSLRQCFGESITFA
jgi:hypothetical protein